MTDLFIVEFLLASLVMGLGIGLDAALATALVAKSQSPKNSLSNNTNNNSGSTSNNNRMIYWLVGITATHTLFPMVGYLLSYFSVQKFPFLSGLIGIIAFALIAQFIYSELKGDSDTPLFQGVSIALLLAVSWDALWSGPAKSAQVLLWPQWAIWCSFITVGAVVAALSSLSCAIIKSKKIALKNSSSLLPSGLYRWLQLGIIFYFGLLALLRYSLNIHWHNGWVFFAAMLVIGLCLLKPLQKPYRSWRLISRV